MPWFDCSVCVCVCFPACVCACLCVFEYCLLCFSVPLLPLYRCLPLPSSPPLYTRTLQCDCPCHADGCAAGRRADWIRRGSGGGGPLSERHPCCHHQGCRFQHGDCTFFRKGTSVVCGQVSSGCLRVLCVRVCVCVCVRVCVRVCVCACGLCWLSFTHTHTHPHPNSVHVLWQGWGGYGDGVAAAPRDHQEQTRQAWTRARVQVNSQAHNIAAHTSSCFPYERWHLSNQVRGGAWWCVVVRGGVWWCVVVCGGVSCLLSACVPA